MSIVDGIDPTLATYIRELAKSFPELQLVPDGTAQELDPNAVWEEEDEYDSRLLSRTHVIVDLRGKMDPEDWVLMDKVRYALLKPAVLMRWWSDGPNGTRSTNWARRSEWMRRHLEVETYEPD